MTMGVVIVAGSDDMDPPLLVNVIAEEESLVDKTPMLCVELFSVTLNVRPVNIVSEIVVVAELCPVVDGDIRSCDGEKSTKAGVLAVGDWVVVPADCPLP